MTPARTFRRAMETFPTATGFRPDGGSRSHSRPLRTACPARSWFPRSRCWRWRRSLSRSRRAARRRTSRPYAPRVVAGSTRGRQRGDALSQGPRVDGRARSSRRCWTRDARSLARSWTRVERPRHCRHPVDAPAVHQRTRLQRRHRQDRARDAAGAPRRPRIRDRRASDPARTPRAISACAWRPCARWSGSWPSSRGASCWPSSCSRSSRPAR